MPRGVGDNFYVKEKRKRLYRNRSGNYLKRKSIFGRSLIFMDLILFTMTLSFIEWVIIYQMGFDKFLCCAHRFFFKFWI